MAIRGWTVWRTIEIGFISSAREMRNRLKKGDFLVAPWGRSILEDGLFEGKTRQSINLVLVQVVGLGFRYEAKRHEIFARAKELGLLPCPKETGPYLRFQVTNQSQGSTLIIGSEPIFDRDGDPTMFVVSCDYRGVFLLGACESMDETPFSPETVFLFMLPR